MRILNLFFLTCLLSVFASCQKEEIYSCNEEVNDWVKENLKEIRTMTRSEWKNLDEYVKRGCFVAFTQQQKVDFWKEKFNEALELGWTKEEAEHIKAEQQFQWSKSTIAGLIATGNKLLDKKGTVQINQTRAMTKSGGESRCNCSTSSDWCSGSVDCQSTNDCDDNNHGCGTLFVYSCDGRCNGI